MKKADLFLGLYILLNLHILRNLSLVGYFTVLALVYIPVIVYCLLHFASIKLSRIALWLLLYFVTALWPSIVTFIDYGINTGVYATVRYFLSLPMALAAFWLLSYEKNMRSMLRLFCSIVLLGLLTIPLQYATGPISWFAEPGERAGVIRYASLLGSLTVAGGVIPFAVLVALVSHIKPMWKVLLLCGLGLGAIFTLQKAALLGIPLAVCVYIVYQRRQLVKPRNVLGVFGIGLLIVFLGGVANSFLADWPVWQNSVAYASAAFSPENAVARGGDVSIQESIEDRLISMPALALSGLGNYSGWGGYLLGGGFGMVGASLVMPEDSPFITSHNGYVDFVLIGGIAHLLAFGGLVCSTLRSLYIWLKNCRTKHLSDDVPIAFLGIVTIALVSLLFAGGLTFQPITGCLFWTIVGIAWRLESERLVSSYTLRG